MEYCVWGWYGVVHDAHSFQASLSEWMKDKPLSILQLDPADRAVLRIADERDAIQKKTFTKWVNKHLKKANREIFDLFDDLRDGLNLISLLEVLSSEKLPREKGVLRFHKLQNVQIALDFLRYRKIKLVNIRAEDIVDGNPKLTLGLIWTIILHFQISDIITHQTDERISAKEALLRWAQRTTDRYPGVRVGDFTKSWRDGLAFNAIIHRNRPDLVDYRSCLKRTARDNLDSAFTIAERELNVTKLLDPEDVDTPEPDEKSLITYISSLYDVFPRPPSHNPFAADDEKSRKVEEYKDLSSSLFLWMRESLSSLQDRNFPNTLVEMKSLLADCTRFRVEEVPPRLHEKQRLSHLFREIQKMHVEVSEELRYETLERLWNKVMAAHQERDQAIHDEIARLEKLQRLAEKVHRETKQCDGKMDDIERHIAEEEKRVQRLHPNDVKYNCDQIDAELKHVEDSLKSMSRDVQTLRDGRYHQALELHKRVQQLHERFLTLRMHFQTRLLNVLATRSLKAEEKKVSKPKPLSLEKLIETNKHFKFLQECIDWVHNKLKYLEEADYGTDLQSVQILLEQHHTEHRLIDQFQKNVDQCSSQKSQFRGEELELYCKLLSKLEKGYSEVLVLSNKRMSDLDTLLDFIQSATNELIWMNEKEEIEINRDWSSKTLNIPEIEDYQRALTIELEKREVQFNSVQDRGESLVLQKHPASKCIEAYLAAMQTQWSWLLQLMSCLDVHLKYAFIYHQFFDDAKECQQWLKQIENRLSTTYSRQNFSIDEGERLMKEMQDLRDELSHYSNVVSSLIERSKDIAPLKQRRQPLPRPLRITAVCSFKQQSMTVSKDEQCWLHDNSNRTKWKIINSLGMEGMVPSVCFVIPPPNPEALELAESLKKQFEAIVNLWTSKQRKLRQNMIFATIKIIKSWDITKFRSIEPLQRESIIKALNEDTQKLLNEGSSDDPALKRLQEEIAYCNKLFADLQRMLDQDEVDKQNKSQARKFNDLCASVQSTLTDKERILKQKTQAPIPRSKEIVNRLVQEQQDFESDLHAFEPRVDEVREAFRELSVKTAALQSRHDSVIESWNNLWSISSLYVERMKAVELTLSHYDDASQATSHAELQLISLDEVPNDTESAARVEENLRTLKIEMQLKQVLFEQVSQSVVNVRHFVELSRPNQSVHTDVTKLEEDVKKVRRRWDLAGTQVNDRLKALETSMELLQSYKGKYNEQKAFVSQMSTKVESMKAVSRMDSREMHHAIESTTSTYHTLSQRKAAIEDVNVDGGRYLREAKMYELLLKQYQESIEDNPADSNAKKAKLISETEIISQELDELNKEYTDLVNSVLQRLNELKSLVSSQEGQKVAIEEKFRLYVDNSSKLLSWLQEKELEMADLGLVREDADDLYRQINTAKTIRQELEDNQRTVMSCIDQAQQLIEQGQDVLSKDEIHTVQKNSEVLKKRYYRASDESEKLLRRLNTALEELRKFSNELINFMEWLKESHLKQSEKEKNLVDLEHLKENADSYKAFSSDVIAHQADLRFITIAAQKFVDESKDYLKVLNNFRTNLPQRLAHLEPGESEVKIKVQEVSTAYQNLLNRIDRLGDKFGILYNKQRNFEECMEKATAWLNSVTKTTKKVIDEPVAADPRAIQDQLDRVKALNMELIQQARLIDAAKQAGNSLLDAFDEADISPSEKRNIENKIKRMEDEYNNICNAVNGRSNELQMALLHSQDIQDGLDRLLKWLDDAESNLRNQNRPVSLIKEKLEEQIQAHRVLLSDIDGQKPTFDAVNDSARELLNSSNQRLAKKIESKLKEVNLRFEKLCEKAQKRSELLEDICKSVGIFEIGAKRMEEWLTAMLELIQKKDSSDLSITEDVMNQKEVRREEFEEVLRSGKTLVSKRDITDTSVVKERMRALEQQWKELGDFVSEQHRKNKEKMEQLSAYEALRAKILEWLTSMEFKVDALEPVALDKEVLRRQSLEIKTLSKEYADYSTTIDKVNDLGNSYDAMLKGESPRHYSGSPRKSASPTRMSPPKHRRSPDYGSPSGRGIQSPLSSISSGFGSSRSSADNLGGIEDLTPIQQQLAEINHRYSLIGIKLSDRSQEINSFSDEVKVYLDSLKNLLSFVQSKERQMPKEPMPVHRDQAAKQLQALKAIQDDMLERQLEFDRLKSQTEDLARRKPTTPGIDNLQMQMSDLAQRWNELLATLKDKTSFLQDLKDFQDSQEAMNTWLGQKEKMFQVLGPIASDPRMVTSQIQQVQVLRDEFTSQEPILNKSRECGHAILDHLDVNSPAAKKIREQLQNTNLRWDDLMNKLTDREQNLAAASGAAKEFQDSLNRLQDRLQHISDDFDHLSEAGTDAVDQLRKLNDLEEQLEDQRPLLAGAEAVCEQLCDVLSDPASKSEIKNKLNGVEKQYNNLNRKMNNRKAELESALKEDKDFYLSFDRIQQWLNDMEDTLSHEFLVSADQDILKRQAQEFESVYKQVLSKDHEVHLLMSKGADMLQKVTRKVDAAQLQNKMDSTKRQWEKVRKIANDRHTLLQKCSENCKKYHNSCNSFVPWLNKCEDKVQSLQPISFQKTQLDKQVKEIQGIKNDLIKHSQEFENTCNFGEVLISCCDIDVENVRDDTDRLRKRWDRLNHDVLERAQALDDISHKLNVYQDKARDVNHSLHRLEDRLLSHDALGDSSKDPKLLARMKALLNEAGDVKRQLNGLRDYVDILVSEASPSVDTSHITNEVEDLENRHRILTQKLEDRCCDLESASEVIAQFNNKMKDAHLDLNHLEEELDNMSPIARDVKTLNAQINQIKNYLHRLKRARDDFEDVEHQCNDIITHGYTPDPKGCRNQLDSLQRQLIRLEERAKTRDNNLDAMLTRLERFYEDYTHISRDLEDTIHEERSFKSVGGEVDAIRSQQEEFKHYHKDRLEPLGKQIDGINKVGQGLIQSASSGVDTSILEQDLDSLNEKWNNLKQKMNERERKLDIAFLQSGKFQDALDGVQKWLEDTEEMVANQKPPSADYKVVKAQLQEQKFLNKLLFDRQNSMSSLMQMGSEIMKNAEPMERMQIESQLNDLMHRFDELSNSAQERTDALERTIPVAKEFQDRIIPLEEWLEQTEKKLAAMATIPTDQEKIRKRMIEHEALHDDIMDHKAAFEELTEVAQTLMSLVGDDEAQMVVEKLQDATNHFAKVVEDSEHIGQLLAEAFQGLGSFNMNYEDLMAWIDEMASRFSRFRTLSVYVDKLQEQLDELVELSEEIADHQKQVDEVANAGQEIMKHASGDDVIRMKEKLDNLSVKFTDLTSRAADKLRQAQDALPLVQNYHASHERVIVWMEDTERQLKNLENVGLSSQETIIQRLEGEIQEYRPLVETLNHLGPQLCQMSPGQGAADIENQVTRINRRFDAICEQVQRKAERIDLSKQRNVEVISDIEDLLDWFHDVEKQLLQAEPLTANPDSLAVLLKEQKVLNDEVSSQKGRVRDILSSAKKLMRESSGNDLAEVRNKADELKEVANSVSAMCADRLAVLEQALPLAEHFFETHADLCQWLDEIESEAELMETPAMNAHQIKKQQDRNKALMQSVHEHKPLVDKLNKTGAALKKLCIPKEAHKVQNIMDSDNSRYNALKDILRDRQNALEEAMQATSQFSDKLDGMLNSLSNTAEQLQNAEPVAAHVEKLEEQLNDNQAVLQDLDKRSNALEAVKRAADDVIVKAGGARDPAVKDIKQKLDKLNQLWDNIQKLASNRNRSLEDALAAAERFWDELTMVMKALKELQDSLNAQEPPAVEPSAIQHQQDALEEIKQEIEQTKPEVEQCRQAGQDLMQLCGEPDKPEVKKHIEDLDSAWENVTSLYAKREQNLVDAMEKAMNFHDILGNILEFLDSAEESFAALGPVGSDIEAVKGQIQQLQEFKQEVDPHMVEIESLNRQAHELMERTSPTQAKAIREPLAEINRRWDDLLKGIVNRQRELENALLRLGQFQHALDEFMAWMSKTEKTLDDLTPVFGDPQVIEVELAKHKVLMNDIQAHQTSVDTLNSAGRQLIEANRGSEDASVTQSKLNKLNKRWQFLQDKAAQRQRELEEALHEAQIFNQEIQDLLMWLSDIDSQLVSSKPVGGLPETAREQLNRFMELYNDLDNNKHKIDSVMQQGQDYLKRSNEGAAGNLQHNLKTLKQRWENVLNRANDRKIKLEIALREATEFHGALQDFVEWLTNAEKFLTSLKPVSRVMDVVLEQIEDHKAFQKEVSAHREVMLNLDKKGTHLKYFSQKQDVILIKNLLISVQHRWERVVSKAAERTRALDHGYKEAKEFHDAWSDLSHWLDDAEKQLDVLTHVGNDPEKIKQMLAKHKEFQRTLGSKQPYFDGTMKLGRNLKEKCPKVDVPVLQDMMDDLKNKWNNVCAKSVDKQRKLEEALLFSGQFKDAVQALIDWLEKAKKTLSENQLLHGDLDTVMALVDQHKSFQDELKSRANNLESVRRTARELLETASEEDANHIREQLSQLDQMWIDVANLAEEKQRKLDEALHEAERLHKAVHMLLEWLSDAEMKLRYSGPLPDDEETTKQQIADHENFMREMIEQEVNKDTTIAHAQEILKKCHPDGVSVIRHWITIIQSRWEEVSLWAKQREQRLNDHLRSLRDILDLLEELLNWLISAENTLTTLEAEPLPDEIPVLEQLIADHQVFMDDMTKRQPDVERVTKAFQSKRQPPQQQQSHPGKDKGRERHESAHDRKSGRSTPSIPKTPANRQGFEPEIKNPRARELVDRWRNVWLLAMERQRRLQDKLNYLKELERIKNFDFDEWRKKFLAWMNNKKSRVMDLFRKIDKDNDGKVTQEEFIEGILKSKFPTSRLEMERVAEIFDRNGDGFIDHKEYIDTLRPDREKGPLTEAEKIQDEVQRQVAECTCAQRFKVYQVGEGKYRFGESQKLRLVRILRSTVMVRVGGGWVALDEFLVKNDPCRAKGRTNLELREQFILAEGVSQSLQPFKPKASPNSSQSSQSASFNRLPATGPITKVREKSERSVPMSKQRSNDSASDFSYSDADSSFGSKSAKSRTPNRLTPGGFSTRNGKPSSRPSSRPPSRAASDLSANDVDSYRARKMGSSGARQRTPSASSQTSGRGSGTKIPTVRRTPSFTNSSSKTEPVRRERERWK
ncbi:microtubule-actin cross-linking factor 1 isoform X6 [Parasteatoda tepidariorum]|uniref:microtubule-actin cross-linking factor 1 isoform X6 n=1 Tax=Parasteatoda tepidariorum TaxID=114398 RepID=UPI0039BD61FA